MLDFRKYFCIILIISIFHNIAFCIPERKSVLRPPSRFSKSTEEYRRTFSIAYNIQEEDFETIAGGWTWVLKQGFWDGIWDPKDLIIITYDTEYKYAMVPAQLHLRATEDVEYVYTTKTDRMNVYRYSRVREDGKLLPNYSTAWSLDLRKDGILFPLLLEAHQIAVLDPNVPVAQAEQQIVPSIELSSPGFNVLFGRYLPFIDLYPTKD